LLFDYYRTIPAIFEENRPPRTVLLLFDGKRLAKVASCKANLLVYSASTTLKRYLIVI